MQRITSPDQAARVFPGAIPVLDMPLRAPVVAGQPSSAAAHSVIQWIETGVGLALSGAVSGLVTAPIAKAPLYAAGFRFPGHTEFLGDGGALRDPRKWAVNGPGSSGSAEIRED